MKKNLPSFILLFSLSLMTACSIPLDDNPRDLSANLPDALLPPAATINPDNSSTAKSVFAMSVVLGTPLYVACPRIASMTSSPTSVLLRR